MILTRIRVKNLKAIKQSRTISFSPGLNIVKGSDNEAGKSSLRVAITKALFQDPTTTSKDILGLTSWGTDEPWEIELDFQTDSESYRITKSIRDRSCQLIDIGSSKVITTNKNAITAKIAEITGCPSEIFFVSTACLEQEEMIRLIPQGTTDTEWQKAFGTINKRLQAKISGSEEADVTNILSRLYSKTHHKDARGPKWQLERIADRIAILHSQKSPHENKVNMVMANRRELNKIEKELEEVNKELPPKQQVMEKNDRILKLQQDIERDKTQYDNVKRARKHKHDLDKIDYDLEKEFACFIGSEDRINKLETAKNELQNLDQQKSSLGERAGKRLTQRPASWILASGIGGLVAGLIGLIASKYLGILAAAGFLLLIYWLISYMAWKQQIRSISSDAAELESKMQEKDHAVKGILSSFGFNDYTEYLSQFKTYDALKKKRKEIADMLRGITGDRDWSEFEKENADLEIGIKANQEELKQLLPFKKDPLDLQKLKNEVDRLQRKKAELEGKKRGLDTFFGYTDADATDQLTGIEEELKWLGQEKEFWERKRNVFEITREALDEAHKKTLSKATHVLEQELGQYVSIITNGRYSQVKIDEGNLSIQTFSPEKGELVDVTQLSRATQDQFYICARFALVKLITKGKQPPLLLDDPFVNFHLKRLEKTIPLLQELAKENQILLFTCSDAFDNCGNVISVD
jgi:DNA repair exonuclease SbcCD ATPase subunit